MAGRARVALLLSVIFAGPLAAPAVPAPSGAGGGAAPVRSTSLDSLRRIDANGLNLFATNLGSLAHDLRTNTPGLIWPKGSGRTAVYAAGLWIGARVAGETRLAVAEYSFEYGPGPILSGGVPADPLDPPQRVYKVLPWTGNAADTAHLDRTAAERAADPQLDPVAHHSWSEYMSGAAIFGAPTRVWRLPDPQTPSTTDSIDVPGPDVAGSQMLWSVFNDADPARHRAPPGGTAPLGVEVRQTLFALSSPENLKDVVFVRNRIINRSGGFLDSMFVSLWSDPDLGSGSDDLAGCDTTRALGFCYNGLPTDGVYGDRPPAVGMALLLGPVDRASGDTLGLTAFGEYIGGTDPSTAQQTWFTLRGLAADGSPILDPVAQQPTRFVHSGDPVRGTGWLDGPPSDKRMMLSSGPFRMAPDDTQEVVYAILVGQGPDARSSVGVVGCLTDQARAAWRGGFRFVVPLGSGATACAADTAFIITNCPRSPEFWAGECALGGSLIAPADLTRIAAFADSQATLFDWRATGALAGFCATVNPDEPFDLRQQARRDDAALLANYAAGQLGIRTRLGESVFMGPAIPAPCGIARTGTIGELVATADLQRRLFDARYLNIVQDHPRALDGVGAPLPFFLGGAGVAASLPGSTLNPADQPDSFVTAEILFDRSARQKCYRYLRLEKADGSAPASVGNLYPYSGFYECPFQVWDVTHGVQLDAMFVERGLVVDDAGMLSPDTSTAIPAMNRTWSPTSDPNGDREVLLVTSRPYRGTPRDEFRLDHALDRGAFPLLYVLASRLRSATEVIDDGDAFLFDFGVPPTPGADSLLIGLESRPLGDPAVQRAYQALDACLQSINAGDFAGALCSGVAPAAVYLVSATVDSGRAELAWRTTAGGLMATVERRVEGGDWAALAQVGADAGGRISYRDADVAPGGRYAWRLAVAIQGRVYRFGEAALDVPGQSPLRLLGASPNPAVGRLVVGFTLATREPARLELADVAGRRVLALDLAGLGPGPHRFDLGESARFRPGLYFVRLTQAGRHLSSKVAIVR